jgi:serine acetyltransferase
VIAQTVKIGKNFVIRQNTTIGTSGHKKNPENPYDIEIGDNVNLGANCCIIGNGLKIGSQVTIAAMSFVNKDIPANVIYITKKSSEVKCKPLKPVTDAQGDS